MPFSLVTFGGPDAGVWGAVWADGDATIALDRAGSDSAAGSDAPPLGRGPGAPGLTAAAVLTADGDDRSWVLDSGLAHLTVEPLSQSIAARQLGGFDQLCRVHGGWRRDGGEQQLDCLGRRACRSPRPDFPRLDALTDVSAWFAGDDGTAMTSARPRGAGNHAGDVRSAAVFEPKKAMSVADPRLSATYTAAGEPLRFSLEMWLEAEGDEGSYPRRVAGEAAGAPLRWRHGDVGVSAQLLRCHSRKGQGSGVYLVARPQ